MFKLILIFTVTFLVQDLLFKASVNATACPKRTDFDSRCKKQCTSDQNCKSKKKNRIKKCLCDGVCGLSCIRVGQACREETSLVTNLRRGFVMLDGKPYQKRKFNFGDEITYKCKKGFTLAGPSKVVCSGIGKWKPWDQGKPSCRRECTNPGNPRNGRIVGRSYEVGKVVRFRCHPGYIREGPLALTCMPNLQWNGQKPKCNVLSCKDPEIPVNGRISRGKQFSYQYGDYVFFSCNAGYFRRGSSVVLCDINGWKIRGRTNTTCAPKSCGHPGYINDGNVEGTLFTYKSIVKFTCNKGYKMTRGNAYRRCLEHQKWSGVVPRCERKDCGLPDDLANGVYDSYGTRYGDRQLVTCKTGYKLTGPSVITCESIGQWSHKPKCELVKCSSDHNSIEHGIVRGSLGIAACNNSYNCRLDFKCLNGYYLDRENYKISICQANGDWSNPKPKCLAKDCGYPNLPQHGKLLQGSNNFLYPSVIQYDCNTNYILIGSNMSSCLADGKWSNQAPFCKANCSDPGRPANGGKIGDSFFGNDFVEFYCKNGYELVGQARIKCNQVNAKWSHSIPQCKPKFCGQPRTLARGKFIGQPSFYFPSIVRYKCNDKYVMQGEAEIKCEENGRWNRVAPSCVANCSDPGIPENGQREGDGFLAHNVLKFKCDYGYQLFGDDEITCRQNDALWSSRKPSCETVKCKDPTHFISNGYANFSSLEFKSVVIFGCNDGFVLNGSKNLSCGVNGNWNEEFPSCKGKVCDKPKRLQNGSIINEVKEYSYPNKIEYKCDEGFNLHGSKNVKCLINGTWSKLNALCKEKTCEKPLNLKNGNIDTSRALFTKDNNHRYKSEIAYVCDKGFELNGEKVSKCEQEGWTGTPRSCVALTDGSCNKPLGMKNKDIKDEQITMQATYYQYEGKKGRLDGYWWCGSYIKYHGEVFAQIKFQSVVKITSVSFQATNSPKYQVTKVLFRYFDAEEKNRVFQFSKMYDVDLQNNKIFNVLIEKPFKCSYFEIVMLRNNRPSPYVCSRFEIYGCNVPSTCEVPKNPINGEVLGLIYNTGDHAVYSCNSGFKLNSDDKQVCLSNGTWTGRIPECVQDPHYIGCYKDMPDPNRVLNMFRSLDYSPEDCFRSCKETSLAYVAGLQYSSQCYCGFRNSLQRLKVDDKECYIPCSKDISRKCGGPWRNSVYRI